MVKSLSSEGFCTCTDPTVDKDNAGVKYCKRCNKDLKENMEEGLYAFGRDFETSVREDNLANIAEAGLDNASDVNPDVDCPFCYGKTGWSYSTGDNGDVEDEAYCGDCDIVYKIATGEFVSGSGDPKTIKAKHNKPATGGAEGKSVNIIKNGKGTGGNDNKSNKKDTPIEKHYCRAGKDDKGNFAIVCDFCPKTFPAWKDAFDHETVDSTGQPKKTYVSVGYSHCDHSPTHVVNGGEEGWNIYAGNKWGCSGKLKNYDIVLNLTGDSVYKTGHLIPIPALSKFASKQEQNVKPIEIVLDWPDMGVLDMGRDWWEAFAAHVKKTKSKVVMFCLGGHGRTGTALASLLVVLLKWGAEESIDWVQKNYCKKAIETVDQKKYVYMIAGEKAPSGLTARKGHGYTKGNATGSTQVTTVGSNDHKGGYQSTLEKGGVEVGEHWGGQTTLI